MASMENRAAVPRLAGAPLVGHLFEFRSNRIGLLRRVAEECGDLGWIRIGPVRVLVVSSAQLAHELLTEHEHDIVKSAGLGRFARPLLGDGLLTSEHALHQQRRRLLAPAFTHRRVATYARVMAELTEQACAAWPDGAELEVADEMMRLTLGVVAKTLFDANLDEDASTIGEALTEAMQYIVTEVTRPLHLPLAVPTARHRRLRRALERLDAIICRVIEQRRSSDVDRGDVLSMLLAAVDEDGTRLSDVEMRDEVMTLMLAGHETTANALAWSSFLLGRHPEAYARLADEADRVLSGRTPTFEDLPRLPYATQVLKESMRLYPPAYMMGRRAERGFSLGGHPVAAGTTLFVNIFGMHHRAEYFAEPERFVPERFAPEAEKAIPRGAFLPFGGGARVCIGNHFALMEGAIMLATLAQRARLELLSDAEPSPEPMVTLRPRGGVRVRVHRRSPREGARAGAAAGDRG
jgi:cytochrome P450